MLNCNSIQNKLDIHQTFKTFKKSLLSVGLVHLRGLLKYPCYGWMNSSVTTDAEPMRNINAAYRHLATHTMGSPIDNEGLPHICHLCCRLGMTYNYLALQQNKDNLDLKSHDANETTLMGQLFPPMLIGLAKASTTLGTDNPLIAAIANLNLLITEGDLSIDPYGRDATQFERTLFFCFKYAEQELASPALQKYLKDISKQKGFIAAEALVDKEQKNLGK